MFQPTSAVRHHLLQVTACSRTRAAETYVTKIFDYTSLSLLSASPAANTPMRLSSRVLYHDLASRDIPLFFFFFCWGATCVQWLKTQQPLLFILWWRDVTPPKKEKRNLWSSSVTVRRCAHVVSCNDARVPRVLLSSLCTCTPFQVANAASVWFMNGWLVTRLPVVHVLRISPGRFQRRPDQLTIW